MGKVSETSKGLAEAAIESENNKQFIRSLGLARWL
jgi:hypothetical protein